MARDGREPASRGGEGREPALRAPWPVLTLVALILLSHALQQAFGVDRAAVLWGLRPHEVAEGRPMGLLTSLFLHAGWTHAGLNAFAALAFGAPVARLFGLRPVQGAAFGLFYLACGVVAGLVFTLLHLGDDSVLVGASGGVAGLIGAASRLTPGERDLAPLASPRVLAMAAAWIVGNLVLAGLGVSVLGGGGAALAWEAHLGGYAAGLFGVGPAAALLSRAPPRG